MKRHLFFVVTWALLSFAQAQTTVFSDNFESGTSGWVLTGTWGLSTASSHSTSHSMTESPSGNYADNINITATMANGVDLSNALSADLSFWAKYTIEGGFDYMYLDVSPNGGTTWITIDSYDDTLSNWTQFNYSLGGYVGNSNVKIRFRFVSDGAVNYDGMYIDDVVITSDSVDNAAPLILHTPPLFYQGVLGADTVTADIIDISGISSAKLFYRVDGGNFDSIVGVNTSGNTYQFIIPQQAGGALVDYLFKAVDSAAAANMAVTDTFSYLAGTYIAYDNGVVDFVDSTGAGEAVAVKISLGTSPKSLKSILIRNYTDVNRPNSNMLVHVWSNNGGMPGTDLITPFYVTPAATLQNTSPMTVVDLRPYASQLSNLTGDVFIGFSVVTGGVWATITSPGIAGRSYTYSSTGWTNAVSGSTSIDFHFRAVVTPYCPPLNVGFSANTSQSPLVAFQDTTNPTPSIWHWEFGDGSTSYYKNPTHTYASYGSYTVSLKVGTANCGLYDSTSQTIVLTAQAPVAKFIVDSSQSPIIVFTDSSTNIPTQWLWDFDDNGATSSVQNPQHIFPATGGVFHVCLTATNSGGSDTYCEDIHIASTIGIEDNHLLDDRTEVYPNPMRDQAFITMTGQQTRGMIVRLYDLQGREVKIRFVSEKNGIRIYRDDLSRGQYVYEVINNTHIIKKGRLMIE